MTHHHHAGFNHNTGNNSQGLKIALLIVVVMMVAEVAGGILSNSLALLGDAGHMLVDALALGISLVAFNLARKPATVTRTYGYHRAEIMAALANGIILFLITAYIVYEAYKRFLNPPEVHSGLMLIVAVLGLVANLIGMWFLRNTRHSSLNVRGAFLHILGDTISSVGVIIGGIIISVTGWSIVDPIIAVLIGAIILWGAVRLVRESTDILMESSPRHINMEKVIGILKGIPGVDDVHDIHLWTITSGIYALSLHVIVQDRMLSHTQEIVSTINHEMAEHFSITHTTLQLECEKCETCAEGLVCQIGRPDNDETEHTHEH
jgi:cobalt-zinc-cadmium efflux system protein